LHAQHWPPSVSIEDGITIDSGDPITQMSDRTSKSTKNSFTTRNETDPSSISIELIPLGAKAELLIVVAEAGIENQFKDLQKQKAACSIVASLDGGSNITDRRNWQKEKQPSPRIVTKDGIATDRNDSQK
jgi:hypothetical protein